MIPAVIFTLHLGHDWRRPGSRCPGSRAEPRRITLSAWRYFRSMACFRPIG